MLHHVTGQLRRALLQGGAHGGDDRLDRLVQRGPHVLGGQLEGLGHAAHLLAAAHGEGARLQLRPVRDRPGRTDAELDVLGGALPDEQRVFLAYVVHDRRVEPVPADAQRPGRDDAAQGDDGDLGGAAADVHDHGAAGFGHGQPGADRCGHRLFDQVHDPGSGPCGRLDDGPPLDRRDTGGDADHHPGAGPPARDGLADEVPDHLLRGLVVADHTAPEWADRGDGAGGAADGLLGVRTDGQGGGGARLHGDHGRLIEDDSVPPCVDEGVGGAQVDPYVAAGCCLVAAGLRHLFPYLLPQGLHNDPVAPGAGGPETAGPKVLRVPVRRLAL